MRSETSKTPTTPHYALGNYAGTGNPSMNYRGNQHWPEDSHPGSDVMPKQSYLDVSLVPPIYGTYKPSLRRKAAKKLRMPKKEVVKYNF